MHVARTCILAFAIAALGCSSCSPDKRGGGPEVSGNGQYWSPPGPKSKLAPLDPSQASATSTTYRPAPETTTAVTGHPRLLVRESDLARLRSWATADNPLWANGLDTLGKNYIRSMDAGEMSKDTGIAYASVTHEGYAEIFAFLSLVHPDAGQRADYAKRARKLLMAAIGQAAQGVAEGKPFRDKKFSIDDRSRWFGEAFPLTVDWIYGTLTAEDKATIRKVFLRWSEEILHSSTTTNDHPEPIGVVNDPKLVSDRIKVRWAANNYFTGHLRNLGLMSLSFDAADDPDDKLRGYLKNVTGAWLYVLDHLLRGDMAGGLGAEGFEYSPQAMGYVAQFLAALHTAGQADPKVHGPQATFQNPWWDAVIPAFLHSISPIPAVSKDPGYSYKGEMYTVAWYGDGQKFFAGDPMGMLGAIGIYDQLVKNDKQLAVIRWIETHVPAGGAAELPKRARDENSYIEPVLTYLLFDPKAPAAPDPRPTFALNHFAPGLQRILARSDWSPSATWVAYKLGWNTIDHQHADGNMFELYRKGEWLTKERTGYGMEIACSDHKNAITIENDKPKHNEGYRETAFKHGSQWPYVAEGDGKLVASSMTPKYVYALGDSTALHNSKYEGSMDVVHASRSWLWVSPDRIITYDRAVSKSDKRFKRWFLNLTGGANTANGLTTMTSPGGQKLFVRSLLPAGATITVEPADKINNEPAAMDPTKFRLKVEAPGGPKSARFLHLIQAADGNGAADNATMVKAAGGTFEGLAFNGTVALFPVDVGAPPAKLSWPASGAKAHIVTGLQPNASYKVANQGDTISIEAGEAETKSDAGGVLVIGTLP